MAGERLLSVLALFISNCRWHCTVQIQLVIAAHDKYTLWRVQVYGSKCDPLYRTVYCGYGACVMATNCSAKDKITHFIKLRVHNNGDQMIYAFLFLPPLISLYFSTLSSSELYVPCACKNNILSTIHFFPRCLTFNSCNFNFNSVGSETLFTIYI